MEKPGISETFNVERAVADSLKRMIESNKQYYPDELVDYAKQLVKEFNIQEIPYNLPETNIKINGKSYGIDSCSVCQIQTHQTAREKGWQCDKCGCYNN